MTVQKQFQLQSRCWILIIINRKDKHKGMTDCMNMEFYRELYVSRSLKKREKRIIEGLKKKRFRKDLI